MATILSILALVVAEASALFAFWAYRASRQSADAATSSERRERQPALAVEIEAPAPSPSDRAIYRLRNEGPDDLDSVVICRPRVKTGTAYLQCSRQLRLASIPFARGSHVSAELLGIPLPRAKTKYSA